MVTENQLSHVAIARLNGLSPVWRLRSSIGLTDAGRTIHFTQSVPIMRDLATTDKAPTYNERTNTSVRGKSQVSANQLQADITDIKLKCPSH